MEHYSEAIPMLLNSCKYSPLLDSGICLCILCMHMHYDKLYVEMPRNVTSVSLLAMVY